MPELTREEKLKLLEKLPQQLQDLLYSEDTGAFLLYLGQKYDLPDEKVHLLSKLVADVVLRIVPITSLTQEINSKITSDAQAATNLAQELNIELLAPVTAPAPSAPATPAPTPPRPADEYREPTVNAPEVVDLRKTPSISAPVAPKPIPSIPAPTPTTPLKPLTSPLTFTRPVQPLIEAEPHLPAKISPEISAGKIPPAPKPIIPTPKPIDTYRESAETQNPPPVSAPIPTSTPPTSEPRPQYIMRPSGAPPTDLPDNVLDLRKDKGEF